MNTVISLDAHRGVARARVIQQQLLTAQGIDYVDLMVEFGQILLDGKADCGNDNIRFNRWLADSDLLDLSKDDRAACMNLACHSEAGDLARREYALCTSPRYVWSMVRHMVCSQNCENAVDPNLAPPGAAIAAATPPETASSAETTDLKTTSADGSEPTSSSVSRRNEAHKLGALGEELWCWFPKPEQRSVLNALARQRHGKKALSFILEQLQAQKLTPPVRLSMAKGVKPTARLALPWLISPLADAYDLSKPSGLDKLTADIEIIKRVCRPVFIEHPGYDRANRCVHALKMERARPMLEEQQRRVAAVREAERDAVNTGKHPPIVVCGEVIWPDGHLPEDQRLTYDEARFGYFFWDHWGGALRNTGSFPTPKDLASFWRQRISAFTGLKASKFLALAQFWMRCVRAFEANPEGESRCQLIDRTV